MKRIAVLICAVVLCLSSVVVAWGAGGSTIVYVTRTGECYHTGSCSYLRNSKIEITLQEAVDQGYRACSRCSPPHLDTPAPSTRTTPSTPSYTPSTPSYTPSTPSYTPPATSTTPSVSADKSDDPPTKAYIAVGVIGCLVGFGVGRAKRKR